jgi:hypothetical protein
VRGTLGTLAKHNDVNSHPWIFLTSQNRSLSPSLSLFIFLSVGACKSVHELSARPGSEGENEGEIVGSMQRTNPQAKAVNVYLAAFLLVFALM